MPLAPTGCGGDQPIKPYAALDARDLRSVHGHTLQPQLLIVGDLEDRQRYYINLTAYRTGVLCALDLADLSF